MTENVKSECNCQDYRIISEFDVIMCSGIRKM